MRTLGCAVATGGGAAAVRRAVCFGAVTLISGIDTVSGGTAAGGVAAGAPASGPGAAAGGATGEGGESGLDTGGTGG